MSEKTIENDFDKAVEFIVESDFNKNLNKCLDIVKELDKKDKEIERLNNIVNEIKEYIEKAKFEFESSCIDYGVIYDILQILNKGESND